MMYQTVLIENITTENVTEKINAKLIEMEKQSYKLVTMSFWGAEKAVLVFKKGLKGSCCDILNRIIVTDKIKNSRISYLASFVIF